MNKTSIAILGAGSWGTAVAIHLAQCGNRVLLWGHYVVPHWHIRSHRLVYWNKFGMPEKGISYVGDWRSPIYYWWIDPAKDQALSKAKEKGTTLPKEKEIIDYWNVMGDIK